MRMTEDGDFYIDENLYVDKKATAETLIVTDHMHIGGDTGDATSWWIEKQSNTNHLQFKDGTGTVHLELESDGADPTIEVIGNFEATGTGSAAPSNLGIGYQVLDTAEASSERNLAVGSYPLFQITLGDDNAAYGHRAGYSATESSRSLYLGHYAGYVNDSDDKMFIGNTDSSGRTLIEGDMSTNVLTVRGDLIVTGSINKQGSVTHGTTIIATGGDAIDVTGLSIIFVNSTTGNRVIGGFANGVLGQTIRIIKTTTNNNIILEHFESSGTQKILTPDTVDLTLAMYGGVELVCDGVAWYVVER
jgi:hypothetical protein